VGKYLVNDTLFIITVRILWATNLEETRDDDGKEVPLDIDTLVDTSLIS
jgi:hypothetical protein